MGQLVICPVFRPNPYTRMCVSTIGSYSTFAKNVKTHGKSLVESCVFGFSLIFDSSVYQNMKKNDEFDNSQMGFECHTRYESNPIYTN